MGCQLSYLRGSFQPISNRSSVKKADTPLSHRGKGRGQTKCQLSYLRGSILFILNGGFFV